MSLKLCTYNICMHLAGLHQNLCDNQKLERMALIIDWLKNQTFDVICLQEVFYRPSQRLLVKHLCRDYHIVLPRSYYCGIYNSGLVTLIRKAIEVVNVHETKFYHQGNFISSIVPRSLQVTTIQYQSRLLTLTNTHLTSPEFYSKVTEHDIAARQQLHELIYTSEIILGDLNLDDLKLPKSMQSSSFMDSTINTQSLLTTDFTKSHHTAGQKDYIIVPSEWIIDFQLSEFDQSDHFPVISTIFMGSTN